MDVAFLAISGAGIVATIVGFVGLGVLSSRTEVEAEAERKLASHRRRTLLEMLDARSTSAQ